MRLLYTRFGMKGVGKIPSNSMWSIRQGLVLSRSFSATTVDEQGLHPKEGERKSWIPVTNAELQRMATQSLIREVEEQQRELASKVVPWFLKNMPVVSMLVPEDIRSQHVKAIAAIHEINSSDLSLKIERKSKDGNVTLTYITSQTKTGSLYAQIQSLVSPPNSELANVQVFSSLDGELALNIFTFKPYASTDTSASSQDMAPILRYAAALKKGELSGESGVPKYDENLFGEAALEAYRLKIRPDYVTNSDPRRFLIMRELYEKVHNNDSASVHIETANDASLTGTAATAAQQQAWITIAAANVFPEVLLRLCAAIVSARQLSINRAILDKVDSPESSTPEIPGSVTVLRMLVSDSQNGGVNMDPESEFMKVLKRDLKRAKWLDNEVTTLGLYRFPSMGLDKAEVIIALSSLVHGPLYKENSQAYASIKSIIELITVHPKVTSIAEEIASLFLRRFNPASPLSDADFETKAKEITAKIGVLQFETAKVALLKQLSVVESVLRTNFYNEDRYALSLRLKPSVLVAPSAVQPYGIFFIHGRHFNAFHCRFRDIARGGLRLVTPHNPDQFALESSRVFDEAYSLSYAQQLKNKDIPEGGAKGVILVNTPSIDANKRFFAMRKAVKGFADSMLDLIVEDSTAGLVDRFGKQELIYLGPDEQIIPSDIDWITQRAAERGYPIPAAFMSSKKDAGFNHKEFGVTSEGIVVYLDVALRKALKVDPTKDPFTVKLTGGPDGDVAGNLIRILFRDYPNTCRIVGVADGFGVAEDPNGLDKDELLRLVAESLPISSFSASKLSPTGISLSAATDEGVLRRNTMHFRVKADAFVPAGGRPNTINSENWQQFLDPVTKEPSSPLIVEGANIFITSDARTKLFEVGKVAIVKDSSANKCGVITSSCEVAASMLLSKKEFMDIKQELVQDVLLNLRNLARLEGELLFREYQNYPGQLPQFSERISLAIALVTDSITDALADVQPTDPLFQELFPLIRENLPKKLADVAGDRISSRFPVQYQRNAIASNLASMLVYKEGIHLIETQPANKIAERAFLYYRAEKRVREIVASIEAEGISAQKDRQTVVDILKRGGARTLLNIF